MKKITRLALAGVACVAVAVPAIALAANPVKGGSYSNQKLLDFATVSKTGKSAKLEVFPGKCNSGIAVKSNTAAKIANGKLTYNGAGTGLGTKAAATLTVSGSFVTSKTLKWTVKVKVGSCTASHSDKLTLMKA